MLMSNTCLIKWWNSFFFMTSISLFLTSISVQRSIIWFVLMNWSSFSIIKSSWDSISIDKLQNALTLIVDNDCKTNFNSILLIQRSSFFLMKLCVLRSRSKKNNLFKIMQNLFLDRASVLQKIKKINQRFITISNEVIETDTHEWFSRMWMI